MEFYNINTNEVLKLLNTTESGLSSIEAEKRLQKYGLNEIKKTKHFTILKILLVQFKSPLVIILIIATFLSLLVKAYIDAIAILAILLLNAILGFSQEYKAEKEIELLKKLSSPKVVTLRNNKEIILGSKYLVPGDIILLETGGKIPADSRLLESFNLKTDESTLTGESTPVEKSIALIAKKVPIAEQKNMVFAGTSVVYGRAKAVIASTGMSTELGKIATLVQEEKETSTPLTKRLSQLSKYITIITVIIVTIIFLIGITRKLSLLETFPTSISLAVAVIPEGLPAVITVTLALSVRKMLKKNSLIRKLQAIETLGSITIIAADKTGTLTKNEMEVTTLFVDNKIINITQDSKNKHLLLKVGASCNDASLPDIGDPTELALLKAASKFNIIKEKTRIAEIPFDSIKKYMLTTHKINSKEVSYIKGAPESVLKLCNFIKIQDTVKKLTKRNITFILEKNDDLAKQALRVLALAYKENNKTIFLGLAGMIDPPHAEVKPALELCKSAGIKVIMLTGDHKETAVAIARQIGIQGEVMQGLELDEISEQELEKALSNVAIFARITPEHKLRILKILQKQNQVIAMTGDGINDAPALKGADVGIAMSKKGTDIARESSDMVLLDDNFASVVSSIKEGRTVYANIKKFIRFLLAANISEILIILISMLAKLPLPLLPLQILFINLATDSLPALALSIDPSEKEIMKNPPRNPKESILKDSHSYIIFAGILGTVSTLAIFILELNSSADLEKARTLALSTLIMFELFFVFSCRSNKTLFNYSPFSNKWLLFAVITAFFLTFIVVQSPLNIIFQLTPLTIKEWLKVTLFSLSGFIFFEIKKLIKPATL